MQAIRRRGELFFPLVVRPWEHGKRERYEVVASQEVYSAVREAGLDRLPVIIKRRLSDQQALELMREMQLYTGADSLLPADSGLGTGAERLQRRGRPRRSDSAIAGEGSENGRVVKRDPPVLEVGPRVASPADG